MPNTKQRRRAKLFKVVWEGARTDRPQVKFRFYVTEHGARVFVGRLHERGIASRIYTTQIGAWAEVDR